MMDFLSTYHLQGLVLGLCSFLIIGICHPIVIKGEYHYGQRFKWVFLIVGVLLCAGSLMLLGHQGDGRATGARAQRLVSAQPQAHLPLG